MLERRDCAAIDGPKARRRWLAGRIGRWHALGMLLLATVIVGPFASGVAIASPPTTAIRYVYDADGQLTGVINPATETAFYSWDPAGNLLSIARHSSKTLSIIQLSPGRAAIGASITISGTGFSKTASKDTVKFNGTKATVTAASEVSLTATVPTGATTGTVTVQTTEGPVTSAQTFTVASSSAPKITSLSKTLAVAGSEVTVSGSNFETTTFGNVLAVNHKRAELLSESASAITFRVPEALGSGPVSVATAQGSSTGPVLFIPPGGVSTTKIGVTGELTIGNSKTVTVSKGASNDALETFAGTAGQRVSLKLSESTFARESATISLYSPQGTLLAQQRFGEGEAPAREGAVAVPTTGNYTVLVEPSGESAGSIKLTAYAFSDVTGSLSPTAEGASKAVAITTPGQRALYSVAVTAGESVSTKISSVAFSPEGGEIEWVNAEGHTVEENNFTPTESKFFKQVRFSTTGTYTLIIRPYGASTGSMTLTAYNASDVTGTITPSAGGETKTVTTTVPGQYARITFAGTTSERVSLVLAEATYSRSARVVLDSPEGIELAERDQSEGESPVRVGPVTLPETGTYTILVEPVGESTGHIQLSAYSVTDVTGSMSPTAEGASKAVSIITPGQRALYSVAVTAGESVSTKISSVAFSPEGGEMEWTNSEGHTVEENNFTPTESKFYKQVRFATTGTYTLSIRPYGVSTGSMTLTLYNASDVTGTITPSAGGETNTVTIGVPGQFARIGFTTKSSETITLKARESTIANGRMSVWNPEGAEVAGSELYFSASEGAAFEFSPSITGTYTILLEPSSGDTGSIQLTAYLGSHPGFVSAPTKTDGSSTLTTGAVTESPQLTGLDSIVAPASGAQAAGRATASARSGRAGPRTRASDAVKGRRGSDAPGQPSSIGPALRAYRPQKGRIWTPPSDNGQDTAWESGELATPWTRAAELQGSYGATAVSGQVLVQNGVPLAGVRVTIAGTRVKARTDEAGRFLLSGGVPAGHHVLVVEGESAAKGQRYGTYEIGVDVTAHVTTSLPYTIWLTPLDPAGDRRIPSPSKTETRLTTPAIPGLEVRIPAGTVITDKAGHVVHKLNLTAIPVDRPPFPLPAFVEVPLYFTVQPGAVWLSKGAQIIYPNWGHLAPGQRVPFWNYDPSGRGWYVYGQGTVTPDGKQVVPDANVHVWEFTGAMITKSPKPPHRGPKPGAHSWGADPVDLATGLYVYHKTDLVLPDSIPITIEQSYRQGDPNSYSFGIGDSSPYEMRLWSENNYHEADLILPDGGRVHYVRTSSGEGYTEAVYESKSTPGMFYASTIKWNGIGWNLTLTNGLTYVFGSEAPLQAIRDRFGNQLTLTREDGQTGNITQITSPHGRWVKLSYDSSNRVTEVKDDAGRTVKYAYNKAGLLESVTDPASRSTHYEYNEAGELTAVKDGRGKTYVETEYEAHERVAKQTLAGGGTYSLAYAENGSEEVEATTVTTPSKAQHKVAFNGEGFPTSEINALGTGIQQTTSYEPQSGSGLPLSVTDPLGRKTTYKYDSAGNITQETLLAGTSSARTLEYTYEPNTNERTSITNALKHTTTYHYGEHGELLSVTDPLGHKTSAEYNLEGQATAITNALGKTTKLGYELGDLTSVTDPLGRTTTRFVDAAGRTGSLTTPGGERTLYEYNLDDQPTKITDPIGASTSYEYDGDGDLTATTDPNKHQSTAAYSALDLLESETDALEHTTKGVYNQEGDLTELTNRDGKLAKFTYDALNRLTEARFGVSGESAESTIKYEYDAGNRLTKVVDSATGTYTPEYDSFNRLKSLATPNGTIGYEYNEADQRTSMTVPGQEPVKYTYDEAGRLTEIKRGGQVVSFGYDAANRPTTTTLVDGIAEAYGYDEANELTSIAYTKGATKLGELDYAYAPNGLREAVWGSYARTGLPEAISSASYNAADEQTERGGKKLGYDAEGNLTSDGTSEYKWNARGQLAEITGAIKASFAYDPFGRRTSKTLGGTTTKLLFDGPNVAQETQGSATANLLTGLSTDSTFARTTSKATESLLADALGSTIALGGSTGKAETSYTYDPFGATTKEGTASENPFQYAGRENDGDGLYDNRARYYSPAAARFISQDPLGQEANGPNIYRYVANSPTNAVDPYGTNLKTPTPGLAASAAGAQGGSSAPGGSSPGSPAPGVGSPGGSSAGFGPHPGSCLSPGKGNGLGEVSSCRNYESLDHTEEEIRRDASSEEKTPWEDVLEKGVPFITGCAAGADVGGLAGSAVPGVGTAVGAATGCVVGGVVNSVVGVNPSEPSAGPP